MRLAFWTPIRIARDPSKDTAALWQTAGSWALLIVYVALIPCLTIGCRGPVPSNRFSAPPPIRVWVSPDGTSLAVCAAGEDTGTRLYLAPVGQAETTARKIPLATILVGDVAWLIGSKGIMFSNMRYGWFPVGRRSVFELLVAGDGADAPERLAISRDVPYCDVSVSPSGTWAAVTRPEVAARQPSSVVQLLHLGSTCRVIGQWQTARGAYGLGLEWIGPNDRLFFPLWDEWDRNRIAVIHPSGSETFQADTIRTAMEVDCVYPSPPGSHIAYQSPSSDGGGGVEQLRLLDVAAGTETVVARQTGLRQVAWSPDGNSLAFVESPSGNLIVHEIGMQSQRVIAHEVSRLADGSPWTEQHGVVYLRGREVWVASPDGSSHKRLLIASELP